MFKATGHPIAEVAVGGIFALSALGLSACADDTTGPEVGTDVKDIHDKADTYAGKEVTVSADVNTKLSQTSFTIADGEMEALLVVSADPATPIAHNHTVKVTGIVHKNFDLPTVEQEMGVDLVDTAYADFDGEPYIEATKIDTTAAFEE